MIPIAKQQGFTLVELMLAISFIGFIVLFTVLATLQVMQTYNKGLSVKEINQTARTVMDDIARVSRTVTYTTLNTSPMTEPTPQNRVCFGNVAYVWNLTNQTLNRYSGPGTPAVTFARVNDPSVCTKIAGTYPNIDPTKATILLSDRVWVQRLAITKSLATGLVTIDMQLSTADNSSDPALETVAGVVRCKGSRSGQYCATATLSTTSAMRR